MRENIMVHNHFLFIPFQSFAAAPNDLYDQRMELYKKQKPSRSFRGTTSQPLINMSGAFAKRVAIYQNQLESSAFTFPLNDGLDHSIKIKKIKTHYN